MILLALLLLASPVWAKLNIVVTKDIKASSLEDALAQAVELKEYDFVEFLGGYSEGDMTLLGAIKDY